MSIVFGAPDVYDDGGLVVVASCSFGSVHHAQVGRPSSNRTSDVSLSLLSN